MAASHEKNHVPQQTTTPQPSPKSSQGSTAPAHASQEGAPEQDAANSLLGKANGIGGVLVQKMSSHEVVQPFLDGFKQVNQLFSGVNEQVTQLANEVSDLSAGAMASFTKLLDKFSGYLAIFQNLAHSLQAKWNDIPQDFRDILKYLLGLAVGNISSFLESGGGLFQLLYEDLVNGTSGAFYRRIAAHIDTLQSDFKAELDKQINEWAESFRETSQTLTANAAEYMTSYATIVGPDSQKAIENALKGGLDFVSNTAIDVGKKTTLALGGLLVNTGGKVLHYFSSYMGQTTPEADPAPSAQDVCQEGSQEGAESLSTPTMLASKAPPQSQASQSTAPVPQATASPAPARTTPLLSASFGAVEISLNSAKLVNTQERPKASETADTSPASKAQPAAPSKTQAVANTKASPSASTQEQDASKKSNTASLQPSAESANDKKIDFSNQYDLGGLEVDVGFKFNFLEQTASKDANALGVKAKLDWQGNFDWWIAGKDINLLKDLNLGMFHVGSLNLNELRAQKDAFAFSLSATNLGLGGKTLEKRFFNIAKQDLRWDNKTGLETSFYGLNLNLPDPFYLNLKADGGLKVKADGTLDEVNIANVQAGDSFTLQSASYKKGNGIDVKGAAYKLPTEYFGPNAEAALSTLKFNTESNTFEAFAGHVTVSQAEPLGKNKGLSLGGHAYFDYKNEQISLGLQGGYINLDKDRLKGSATGVNGLYQRKASSIKTPTGDKSSTFYLKASTLEASYGLLGVSARDAEVSNIGTEGFKFSVKEAEILFKSPKDASKEAALSTEDQTLVSQSAAHGALASLKAEGVTYDSKGGTGKKLKWTKLSAHAKVPRTARFSVLGGAVKGGYDLDEGKGDLAAHFSYPKGNAPLLPAIGASYPIIPGVNAFADFGVRGGIDADLGMAIKAPNLVKKADGNDGATIDSLPETLGFSADAALSARLGVQLRAGLGVGLGDIGSARAYISAAVNAQAQANAKLQGTLEKSKDKDAGLLPYTFKPANADGVIADFHFFAKLTAQVDLVADLVAFFVYEHELYRLNLKTWDLGELNLKGRLLEDKSTKELRHEINFDGKFLPSDQAGKGNNSDGFFGGLLTKKATLNPDAFQPVPVQEALPALHAKQNKISEEHILRRFSILLAQASLSDEERTRLEGMLHELANGKAGKKAGPAKTNVAKENSKATYEKNIQAQLAEQEKQHAQTKEDPKGSKTLVETNAKVNAYLKAAKAKGLRQALVSDIPVRVFDTQTWKELSANSINEKKRDKIADVDSAVANYNLGYEEMLQSLKAHKGKDSSALDLKHATRTLSLLKHIEKECLGYLVIGKSRSESVYLLMSLVTDEKQQLTAYLQQAGEDVDLSTESNAVSDLEFFKGEISKITKGDVASVRRIKLMLDLSSEHTLPSHEKAALLQLLDTHLQTSTTQQASLASTPATQAQPPGQEAQQASTTAQVASPHTHNPAPSDLAAPPTTEASKPSASAIMDLAAWKDLSNRDQAGFFDFRGSHISVVDKALKAYHATQVAPLTEPPTQIDTSLDYAEVKEMALRAQTQLAHLYNLHKACQTYLKLGKMRTQATTLLMQQVTGELARVNRLVTLWSECQQALLAAKAHANQAQPKSRVTQNSVGERLEKAMKEGNVNFDTLSAHLNANVKEVSQQLAGKLTFSKHRAAPSSHAAPLASAPSALDTKSPDKGTKREQHGQVTDSPAALTSSQAEDSDDIFYEPELYKPKSLDKKEAQGSDPDEVFYDAQP